VKKFAIYILTIAMIASIAVTCFACSSGSTDESSSGNVQPKETRIRLATTTSLYDTGLWSLLEPMYEEEYGVELDILYAGSGIAFEYGRNCDVDVLTIHSKADELTFVSQGYGVERIPFAYNHFVIVGPADDPAGIDGMSPEEAFATLAEQKSSPFISRGDNSGTHSKEKAIWAAAGYNYSDITSSGDWYVSAGKGMAPTLLHADEVGGYTLSDIGTFLANQGNLVSLVDSGSIMLNVYSVIAINSSKCTSVSATGASNMVEFLTSDEVQDLIDNYGAAQYGQSLFTACFGNEPTE
jgi:tungstate transport system substrate-binding protein